LRDMGGLSRSSAKREIYNDEVITRCRLGRVWALRWWADIKYRGWKVSTPLFVYDSYSIQQSTTSI